MQYGRTQSAPLPLAHPGLLAPPEVRQGKTSPELDGAGGSLVKQQIRQSVLSRHHRAQHQVAFLLFQNLLSDLLLTINHQPLDPMLAMAELSQMQVGRAPEETQPKVILPRPNLHTLLAHSLSLNTKFTFSSLPFPCVSVSKIGIIVGAAFIH